MNQSFIKAIAEHGWALKRQPWELCSLTDGLTVYWYYQFTLETLHDGTGRRISARENVSTETWHEALDLDGMVEDIERRARQKLMHEVTRP